MKKIVYKKNWNGIKKNKNAQIKAGPKPLVPKHWVRIQNWVTKD